jgi:hypothetical protein
MRGLGWTGMPLLDVLRSFETKLNAHLGLNYDERTPEDPVGNTQGTDARRQREKEERQARLEREKLREEQERRKKQYEQECELKRAEQEACARVVITSAAQLKPGHFYTFNNQTLYFICALGDGRLVFSSKGFNEIRDYRYDQPFDSNNQNVVIVTAGDIPKSIREEGGRTIDTDPGFIRLSQWIQKPSIA